MKRAFEDMCILKENNLTAAIRSIVPDGIRVACRTIREGDEAALLPGEAPCTGGRAEARRRASGAARVAARGLLQELGVRNTRILHGEGGQPIWVDGITGSLAHDDTMAVATICPRSVCHSLGSDIEPSLPLPDDLVDLVVTGRDDFGGNDNALAGRLVFSAKEAVYKAVYPLDGEFLEFADIAVNLAACRAQTRSGRILNLSFCTAPRIVTLAMVEA